jgi:hypothetical protein
MMRARNIKPGFFKNDVLAECDALARILFEGLWCLADREGRLEFHPKRIKAEILPYDDCDIIKLIEQLRERGFITVYTFDNEFYLDIPTFTRHQNCHIKEAESTIPAPCENDTCTVVAGPLTESRLLITDSPLPKSGAKKILPPGDFEQFWKIYPKKQAKGDAEKAWKKIKFNNDLLKTILGKIEQAKKSEDWIKNNGQYIPLPATWLNGKRWEDEIKTEGASNDSELSYMDKKILALREEGYEV